MDRDASTQSPKLKPRKQVAALPVMRDGEGNLRVMLITSRETRRLIIPKGWPMKGRKDYRAAAIEAKEEAGLVGKIHRKPIGTYTYWKRRPEGFVFCIVKVFVMEVLRQLPDWRERSQRWGEWMDVEEAAGRVDDVGLTPLIRSLPKRLRSPRRKGRGKTAS